MKITKKEVTFCHTCKNFQKPTNECKFCCEGDRLVHTVEITLKGHSHLIYKVKDFLKHNIPFYYDENESNISSNTLCVHIKRLINSSDADKQRKFMETFVNKDDVDDDCNQILGLNRTAISLYEQGRSTPNFAMLVKIKKQIGCSYDTLIDGELE